MYILLIFLFFIRTFYLGVFAYKGEFQLLWLDRIEPEPAAGGVAIVAVHMDKQKRVLRVDFAGLSDAPFAATDNRIKFQVERETGKTDDLGPSHFNEQLGFYFLQLASSTDDDDSSATIVAVSLFLGDKLIARSTGSLYNKKQQQRQQQHQQKPLSFSVVATLTTPPLPRSSLLTAQLDQWSRELSAGSSFLTLAADGLALASLSLAATATDEGSSFLQHVMERVRNGTLGLVSAAGSAAPLRLLDDVDPAADASAASVQFGAQQLVSTFGQALVDQSGALDIFVPPASLFTVDQIPSERSISAVFYDCGDTCEDQSLHRLLHSSPVLAVPMRSKWTSFSQLQSAMVRAALDGQSMTPFVLECQLGSCQSGALAFAAWVAQQQSWIQMQTANQIVSATAISHISSSSSSSVVKEYELVGRFKSRFTDSMPWSDWLHRTVFPWHQLSIENMRAPRSQSLSDLLKHAWQRKLAAIHRDQAPTLHRAADIVLTSALAGSAVPWTQWPGRSVYRGLAGSVDDARRILEQFGVDDQSTSLATSPEFQSNTQAPWSFRQHAFASDQDSVAQAQISSVADLYYLAYAADWAASRLDDAHLTEGSARPVDVDHDGIDEYVFQTSSLLVFVDRWGARVPWAFVRGPAASNDAMPVIGQPGALAESLYRHVEVVDGSRASALVSRWSSGRQSAVYGNLDFGAGAPVPIHGGAGFQFQSMDGGLMVRISVADDVLLAEYQSAGQSVGQVQQTHGLSLPMNQFLLVAAAGTGTGVLRIERPPKFKGFALPMFGFRTDDDAVAVGLVGLHGVSWATGAGEDDSWQLQQPVRLSTRNDRRRWALALAFSTSAVQRLATDGINGLPSRLRPLRLEARHFSSGGQTLATAQEAVDLAGRASEPGFGDLRRRSGDSSALIHPFRQHAGQHVFQRSRDDSTEHDELQLSGAAVDPYHGFYNQQQHRQPNRQQVDRTRRPSIAGSSQQQQQQQQQYYWSILPVDSLELTFAVVVGLASVLLYISICM